MAREGDAMDAIAYSNARKQLAKLMEQVCEDHDAVIITRRNAGSVVMISLEDYNAIQETAYLLNSPANAERLRKSIDQYATGKHKPRELVED